MMRVLDERGFQTSEFLSSLECEVYFKLEAKQYHSACGKLTIA